MDPLPQTAFVEQYRVAAEQVVEFDVSHFGNRDFSAYQILIRGHSQGLHAGAAADLQCAPARARFFSRSAAASPAPKITTGLPGEPSTLRRRRSFHTR